MTDMQLSRRARKLLLAALAGATCLAGTTAMFGWLVFAVLMLAIGWGGFGYLVANAHRDIERQELVAEWNALERRGQVRAIMLDARRAMQAEAMRPVRRTSPRPRPEWTKPGSVGDQERD